MKRCIACLIVFGIVFALAHPASTREPKREQSEKKTLKQYDVDGNDRLDRQEPVNVGAALIERRREAAKAERNRRGGEINAPPAKGERHRDRLSVGDPAPDFTLSDPSGKKQVTLSSFSGKRPVVLIFGSFT